MGAEYWNSCIFFHIFFFVLLGLIIKKSSSVYHQKQKSHISQVFFQQQKMINGRHNWVPFLEEGMSLKWRKKVSGLKNYMSDKGQIISEANYLFLNSSKKRTKNFCPSSWGNILEKFRSFFGRIENKIICFWNYLTFSADHSELNPRISSKTITTF